MESKLPWRCPECDVEGFVMLPHPEPENEAFDMHQIVSPGCQVLIEFQRE